MIADYSPLRDSVVCFSTARITRLSGTPAEEGVRGSASYDIKQGSRGLSGTPAEAGVRGAYCYAVAVALGKSQWNPCRSRGASCGHGWIDSDETHVSVEPLPKQGCERACLLGLSSPLPSLSGTPAEAGVRVEVQGEQVRSAPRLSGTPAEAGVRVAPGKTSRPPSTCLSGTPAEAGVREGRRERVGDE